MYAFRVEIDYTNSFEFLTWNETSSFIESALRSSTKAVPELKVEYKRYTPTEDEE